MPPATTRGPIPLSQPLFTLLDLAPALGDRALESALNEADKLNLIHPKQAGKSLEGIRAPGIARLRRIVAGHKRTDSDLERDFLRLVRNAGLPEPETQRRINGHRVDFYWPQHNLVVETDGSAYHRTPSQQIRDRKRDQDPDYVVETLRAVQQLQ